MKLRNTLLLVAILAISTNCIMEPSEDSEERRDQLLDKYFPQPDLVINRTQIVNLFKDYVLYNVSNIDEIVQKAETVGNLTMDEHEAFSVLVIVDYLLELKGIETATREQIKDEVSIQKLVDFAQENIEVLLKKMVDFELSRSGASDEEREFAHQQLENAKAQIAKEQETYQKNLERDAAEAAATAGKEEPEEAISQPEEEPEIKPDL